MGYTGTMAEVKDPARGARYKAARLAFARKMGRPITQMDVANHFGIEKGTVSRWETGETSPHEPKKVAEFYECAASFLEFGEGDLEWVDPPYQAWRDFLETERPEPWQISTLRTMSLPEEFEPSLELYQLMLFALKAHAKRRS